MLNRFWTMHLFGVKNGAMDGPKAVVERENNQWVEYADWPVPGAAPVTARLTAGDANAIGRLGLAGRPAATTERIVDDASIDANVLIAAATSPNRLVYQTPPLVTAVHLSGTPTVTLRLAFDRPAANVSAMAFFAGFGAMLLGGVLFLTRVWGEDVLIDERFPGRRTAQSLHH